MARPSPPLLPVPQTTAIFFVMNCLSQIEFTKQLEAYSIKSIDGIGLLLIV